MITCDDPREDAGINTHICESDVSEVNTEFGAARCDLFRLRALCSHARPRLRVQPLGSNRVDVGTHGISARPRIPSLYEWRVAIDGCITNEDGHVVGSEGHDATIMGLVEAPYLERRNTRAAIGHRASSIGRQRNTTIVSHPNAIAMHRHRLYVVVHRRHRRPRAATVCGAVRKDSCHNHQ